MLYTICSILYMVYSILDAMQCVLYTRYALYSKRYTIYSILYTEYGITYSLCNSQTAKHWGVQFELRGSTLTAARIGQKTTSRTAARVVKFVALAAANLRSHSGARCEIWRACRGESEIAQRRAL